MLPPETLRDSAALAPKNNAVNKADSALLVEMPGREFTCYFIDYAKDEDGSTSYPIEFLNTVQLAPLPPV